MIQIKEKVILDVEDLTTHYFTSKGEVKALDNASFQLKGGQSIGIAGESGCGKSTLAFSLLRMVQPPGKIVSGSIRLGNLEVTELDEEEARKKLRWQKISMVFQGAMDIMTPVYSVGHQMMEPLRYLKDIKGDRAKDICFKYLDMVNIDYELFYRYPHELSGGQKQRIIIATSLLLEPDVVILDEPTTALDVVVEARIMNDLKVLKKKLNNGMIFITHDLSILAEISDILAIMYAGWIVELGSAIDIYKNPKHPYTQKLIAAIPRLHMDIDRLEYIPGAPPELTDPPKGCRFHPRCEQAFDRCSKEEPDIHDVEGVKVKCHLYDRRG